MASCQADQCPQSSCSQMQAKAESRLLMQDVSSFGQPTCWLSQDGCVQHVHALAFTMTNETDCFMCLRGRFDDGDQCVAERIPSDLCRQPEKPTEKFCCESLSAPANLMATCCCCINAIYQKAAGTC